MGANVTELIQVQAVVNLSLLKPDGWNGMTWCSSRHRGPLCTRSARRVRATGLIGKPYQTDDAGVVTKVDVSRISEVEPVPLPG